jgi:hypothetical protein
VTSTTLRAAFAPAVARHFPAFRDGTDERHSGQLEELDVEGILAFAERVLPRAADLWVQASLEQRQRFQQLFFPFSVMLPLAEVITNRRDVANKARHPGSVVIVSDACHPQRAMR